MDCKNIDEVLQQRGESYGEFINFAFLCQSMKELMRSTNNWNDLHSDTQEALDMIAHKICRVLNGDSSHVDSWTDIQGYARLVEKRLIEEISPFEEEIKEWAIIS